MLKSLLYEVSSIHISIIILIESTPAVMMRNCAYLAEIDGSWPVKYF